MLVLTREDLKTLWPPRDVVDALATGFAGLASGRCTVPPRSSLPVDDGSVLLLMPALSCGDGLGAKLVSVYAANRARGLPTLYATFVLMDETTGQPLAVVEGTYLTALRTGAASALAARYLARPDSRRLTCFGAGAQAAFQLRCLAAVLPVERVDVVGRDPARAAACARAMAAELGIAVEIAADSRRAVAGADVVTCATTSPTPVVRGADLRDGTHVDAVAPFAPPSASSTPRPCGGRAWWWTHLRARSRARATCGCRWARGAFTREHVAAELAQLVTGVRPGRTTAAEITVFKSVGFALEDLVAARLAYNRAMTLGMGTEVAL